MSGPLAAVVADLADDRDQARSLAVADRLAKDADPEQIAELVTLLAGKEKGVSRAAAHLAGEVADRRPDHFLPHVSDLIDVAHTASGPAAWETLHVLAAVASHDPSALAPYLDQIEASLTTTSVIARDNTVRILTRLATLERSRPAAMNALLQCLRTAPVNQLPMYAELVSEVVRPEAAGDVRGILTDRLAAIPHPAKIRRIEAVLRKLPEE
jgi:hypothetical protein